MDITFSNVFIFLAIIAMFILGRKSAHLDLIPKRISLASLNDVTQANSEPEKVTELPVEIEYVLYFDQDCKHCHKCTIRDETKLHYDLQLECEEKTYSIWVKKDSVNIRELISKEIDTSDNILDEQLIS